MVRETEKPTAATSGADRGRGGGRTESIMKLICIGDSLIFGYQVPREHCWTTLFSRLSGWEVVNRGISGDTTGGMLARLRRDALDLALEERSRGRASRVLVMGGGNDIFFSGTADQAKANIAAICYQLEAEGLSVLLGIPLPIDWTGAPENWASFVDFRRAAVEMQSYSAWLRQYSQSTGIPSVDLSVDFLDSAGQVRRELLVDGIHPNQEGHRKMAERLKASLFAW